MLRVLRFRDFRLLWSAGLISSIGDWALRAGLPFEIYRLTGSTLATAAYLLAGLLPQVLFGSTAGVFVDRWDRRKLMIWVNVALALALIPLLGVETVGIWIVYATVIVAVILGLLFEPAEMAVLPRLRWARAPRRGELAGQPEPQPVAPDRPRHRWLCRCPFRSCRRSGDRRGVLRRCQRALIAFIPSRPSFKPAVEVANQDGVTPSRRTSASSRLKADLREGVMQVRGSHC